MNKKSIVILIFIICITALAVPGCYYDKGDLLYHTPAVSDCTTNPAKFSTDIAPLMQTKCATSGCHDAASAADGLVLESYTQISTNAAIINQRCVIDKTMPPGAPLSSTDIALLSCWINAGAPNN